MSIDDAPQLVYDRLTRTVDRNQPGPGDRLPALSYAQYQRLQWMIEQSWEIGKRAGIREERNRVIAANATALSKTHTDTAEEQ